MNGFEAWAASFHGTMAVAACALVAGMILGWLAGTRPRGLSRRERRDLADAAAERAARQFRRIKRDAKGADFMTDFIPPRRTSTAAFLDPTPYGAVMFAAAAPELAHEWEPAHVASALAVAHNEPDRTEEEEATGERPWHGPLPELPPKWSDDPITTGEIRAIAEDMDVFMARLLGEHPVPWPDGSGQ